MKKPCNILMYNDKFNNALIGKYNLLLNIKYLYNLCSQKSHNFDNIEVNFSIYISYSLEKLFNFKLDRRLKRG